MQILFDDGFEQLTPEQQSALLNELKRIARHYMMSERSGHTLQATELVNEAYVNLSGKLVYVENKAHFIAIAARQMRRVLVDHARKKLSVKREHQPIYLTLSNVPDDNSTNTIELIHIDKLLKELTEVDKRCSQVMELHLFSTLHNAEIAGVVGVSLATVERDLKLAKAWLKTELSNID